MQSMKTAVLPIITHHHHQQTDRQTDTHTHTHEHTLVCCHKEAGTYQCLVNGGMVRMGVAGILEEVPEKEHVTRNPLNRFD